MNDTNDPRRSPMHIRLTDERRARVLDRMHTYFQSNFDEPLSDFKAERLLEFFVAELGPPVYNQAIRDASRFVEGKLADLEGEFYEPGGD